MPQPGPNNRRASAAVDRVRKLVVINNVYRFWVCLMANGTCLRRLRANTVSGRPCSGQLSKHGSIVITGGHDGSAYVYSLDEGTKDNLPPVQTLPHNNNGKVQLVLVSNALLLGLKADGTDRSQWTVPAPL